MNFIKDYFKNMSIRGYLNLIVLILLGLAIFKACKREHEYEALIRQQSSKVVPKTETSIEAEEIGRELDTAGKEKVVYRLSEPIIREIENHTKIDSFAREIGVEKNKVKSASTIIAQLSAENKDLIRIIESNANGKVDTVFKYNDPWLSLEGFRLSDTVFRLRNIIADASVNRVDHIARTRWFSGRNEDRSTVWFNSKYVRVNGMNSLTVISREPFFDWGAVVEGRYQNIDQNLYIGPRANVKLGRMNIEGGYNWRVTNDVKGSWWTGASYRLR